MYAEFAEWGGKPRKPPRPLTGRAVLLILLGFFGVVIAVNVALMRFALSTMPGVEDRNGYEENQRYNAEIQQARAQAALGWHAGVSVRLDGTAALVSVSMADRAGKPLSGLSGTIALHHPADRKADRQTSLSSTTPGIFTGRIEGVRAGIWDLSLAISGQGEQKYESRNRIVLKD